MGQKLALPDAVALQLNLSDYGMIERFYLTPRGELKLKKSRIKMNNRQRGVALIVILLLLAVMVSIAASMADRLFSQFKRASNQVNHQQAYWYSVSAEALAKVALEQSLKTRIRLICLSRGQ